MSTADTTLLTGEQKRSISRRLKPLYVAAVMQGFMFWYAIEKPFLDEIGLGAVEISMIVIVITTVTAAVNVPLGIAGDRWSRKHVLMAAGVAIALASATGGLSNSFNTYLVSAVFAGVYIAARSGCYDSIVYDLVLEETGTGDSYNAFYGRLRVYEGIALTTSSLLGALVAWQFETRSAFFITVPFALASVAALVCFNEPKQHRAGGHANRRSLFRTAHGLLRKGSSLSVVVASLTLGAALLILLELDQLWLIELDFPLVLYGPLNALLLGSIAAGAFAAGHVSSSLLKELTLATVGFIAACGLLVENVVVVIAAQALFTGIFTMLSILLGKRLHDVTPSNVRSSVSSLVSTVVTLIFVPVALLFGQITATKNVFDAAWIPVCMSLLLVLGYVSVVVTNRAR